mmetsp:Transcript_36976/g.92879  ORF Transcript_36976/g.92879 Transcript_36976/m.92879 type:complete len:278 (-) Transcript_36976:98-931(-)
MLLQKLLHLLDIHISHHKLNCSPVRLDIVISLFSKKKAQEHGIEQPGANSQDENIVDKKQARCHAASVASLCGCLDRFCAHATPQSHQRYYQEHHPHTNDEGKWVCDFAHSLFPPHPHVPRDTEKDANASENHPQKIDNEECGSRRKVAEKPRLRGPVRALPRHLAACLCPNHSAQPTGGKERCPGGSSHTFCGRSVDSLTLPWTNGWSAEAQILRLTNAAACTMLIFGLEGKRVGESLQRVLTERSRVGLEVGPGWKIEVFSPGRDATRGGQPLLQ